MNKNTKAVNEYVLKMSRKENFLYFLDNDEDLLDKDIPIKSFYDNNDASGIHLNAKGANVLEENIQTFFDSGSSTEYDFDTPMSKKRNRSVLSNTPPSDKQSNKSNRLTSQ